MQARSTKITTASTTKGTTFSASSCGWIYKQDEIHWCIWLYQDIGYQGMFHANPHSAHMRRPNPFFEKEKRVDVDKWSRESASDAEQAAD